MTKSSFFYPEEFTGKPFKLVAIRPLAGCNPKYLKNLKPDTPYIFDRSFKFEITDKDKIQVTREPSSVPDSLYYIKNTCISISAIVGENGSGKSSLIELLYAGIFNVSVETNVLYRHHDPEQWEFGYKTIADIKFEVYFEIDQSLYVLTLNYDQPEFVEDEKSSDWYHHWECIEGKNEGVKRIYNRIQKIRRIIRDEEFEKINFNHFFYSVILNYSHHGLNPSYFGEWITGLFHKNDGYQTPIVLNPLRNDGNIDINSENHLVQSRLIANILRFYGGDDTDSLNGILGDRSLEYFKFKLDKNKFALDDDLNPSFDYTKKYNFLTGTILDVFFPNEDSSLILSGTWGELGLEYIFRKIESISKYSNYHFLYEVLHKKDDESIKNVKDYLGKMLDDESHVVFKLKQVLNFLKNSKLQELIQEGENIDLSNLYTAIAKDGDEIDVIEFVPPAIFKIDLCFSEDNNDTLEALSSGEKHMIHTSNSIVYHLTNIQSILYNQDENKKYKYINIVFDEIELYFHPEFQRKFVSTLLKNIEVAKIGRSKTVSAGEHVEGIKGINILLLTHSPFILSDIPSQNVLRLKDGESDSDDLKQTFGANIHTLLQDSFFMKGGLIGEYGRSKIDETINWLNSKERDKGLAEYHKSVIRLVGEPLLKMKLAEMYDEVMNEELEITFLQKRIDALRDKKK